MNLKAILKDAYTDDIEKAINDAVSKDFVARSEFNVKNDALKNTESVINDYKTQLETLKTQNADNAALQATIAKLQTDNAAAEKAHADRLAEIERDYALKDVLKTQGARDVLSVLPHIDTKAVIFNDGKFTGLDEQVKALKTSKAFLKFF
jgi:DNA repair exonuclease SbcCD ATPase subunit